MAFTKTSARIGLGLAFLLVTAAGAGAQERRGGERQRSDPPGFGIVTVQPGQTIRLHVTCFPHEVGDVPPGPCRGTAMFHDAAGNVLIDSQLVLKPGESRSLDFTVPRSIGDAHGDFLPPVAIDPCWIRSAGRAIPSIEVFDAGGRPILFAHPAAARMTEFNNTFTNPGEISGFNPQPDPPGFGLVTLMPGQVVSLNVACFEHPVGGHPPDPCRGTVMLHDAAGRTLVEQDYELQPGQARAFRFSAGERAVPLEVEPCVMPSPGGRAVPNVEIMDGATGQTMFLINPAAARMSEFQ